jgi:multiple sugar transport system substrate-binding protein
VLKRIVLVALILAAVVFCAVPTQTARKYPNRKPVRFWHMWTAEWEVVVNRIADRFNESQDEYEVIPLSVPSSGADYKFMLSTVGGDPPDVMAQWNAVIPTWAENGLLTPLDELMSPEEYARFKREAYPVVQRVGFYKGKLYGVTIGLNVSGCFYLPKHFREASLDANHFPETLEELVADAEKLNRFDKNGNLVRLGFSPPGITSTAPLFGGGFYDWKTGEVTINTPENRRALQFLVDYRKKLGYENVVRFESGLDTGSFAGGWPFIGGAYSVAMEGAYRVEQIAKYAPDLEYRTAPMPPPKGGVPRAGYGSGNFMIMPKTAKNRDGAWKFVKFWSGLDDPARAAEFYTWGGWLPLSPAVAESPIYQEYLRKYPQFKTFLDLLPSEDLQTRPPVAYQVFLMDQLTRYQDMALRGTLTPDQALQALELEVQKERQRRKEMGLAH